MLRIIFTLLFLALPGLTKAHEPPRDTLWMTTTLRAAPGELKALISDLKALEKQGFYSHGDRIAPLIMRHSQGDQWDLMLLEPIGSYAEFFAPERLKSEGRNTFESAETLGNMEGRITYKDELFAYGPSPEFVAAYTKGAGFFHIEMFDALPGMNNKLLEQREMENAYLVATKRRGNLIFDGDMGTNVDSFTIGAYKDLAAFAARPDLAEGASLKAAKDAGFEDDNSIGFYLRTLISAHHDTLANRVK
ncbi:MAG: hypothetical protein COA85_00980 [Robiginitomaculum sp.]|nr:MAG: hypothetical protein COA85_00980 [Robiginitomaculum sp.]